MDILVQTDKYITMNTTDTTKMTTMWLNSYYKPTHYKKKKCAMEKQYCWQNSCQIPIRELYARQHEVAFVTKNTTKQSNFSHTHNCTFTSWMSPPSL